MASLELIRYEECQFHSLIIVQTWVNGALVCFHKVRFSNLGLTTDTFGNIVAGQLEVNAAQNRTVIAMNLKLLLYFFNYLLKAASLNARLCRKSISVHWVTCVEHSQVFLGDSVEDHRQAIGDLVNPIAMDQRDSAWFVVRIE